MRCWVVDTTGVGQGDLEVRLIHFERPAHTTNDTVVWLPDRDVVFTGDHVFSGGTPFALQGSIPRWRQTLPDVRALGASVLVPGHHPVTTPVVLDDVDRHLGALAARRDGLTALEAARKASSPTSPTSSGSWATCIGRIPNWRATCREPRSTSWRQLGTWPPPTWGTNRLSRLICGRLSTVELLSKAGDAKILAELRVDSGFDVAAVLA